MEVEDLEASRAPSGLAGDMPGLVYPGMSVDVATGLVELAYELHGDSSVTRFVETLRFPPPNRAPDPGTVLAFHRALELLYVVAGTSYYKVAAPSRVDISSIDIAPSARPWVEAVFRKGLAEYAYRNNLPHVLDLEITTGQGSDATVIDDRAEAGRRPVVAMGGGKDSIVSVEALKQAHLNPVVFAVRPNDLIRTVMATAGCETLVVQRDLDPKLFGLNAGGALNGHIPVTAINSLIGVAASLLHGYGPVVMSNERSASDPNLTWLGREVNHQWSKSLEAETLLRNAIAGQVGAGSAYFSLLRGMSELHIASLFAGIDGYTAVASSCNRAYRIVNSIPQRWCGDCDKCRFVFLALAPFLDKRTLVSMFDKDLLDDPDQVPGYRALLGVADHKPFECVGEAEECVVALDMLRQRPEWSSSVVLRRLEGDVPDGMWPTAEAVSRVLNDDQSGFVPPAYRRALDNVASGSRTPA